tara:strand:- start:4151 stop:4648 length:498 start_codon:yes stop_codon:yes gene_type:complete
LFLASKTNTQTTFAALDGKHNCKLGGFQVADADQITRFAVSSGQESTLGIHERQQSHDPGTLDSVGEITLLFCSEASKTSWQNFAALCNEFLQQIHILVIDGIAGLDWRKALLEEGARHESETIGKLDEQQAHLISLWRVILLSCGQNFISSSLSVVFRRFFSVV